MRIRSNNPASVRRERTTDQGLGSEFVRAGYLQAADVDSVLDRMAINGGTFGDMAIEMGLLTKEAVNHVGARQRGAALLSPGDDRVDPMLVAAFDGDNEYMSNVRAIRSRLISPSVNQDTHFTRSCVLIAMDCDQEAAVLAANLALLVVRGGVPTLLVDALDHNPILSGMFRMTSDHGNTLAARETVIPQLWLHGSAKHALAAGGGVAEGEPVIDRANDWSRGDGEVIAVVGVNDHSSVLGVAAAVRGMDSVLIVARKHVTAVSAIQELIDGLDSHAMYIAGTVLV